MSDLIERQAAIDHWRLIINATNKDSRYNMGFVDGLELCINHLITMPSAQTEKRTEERTETHGVCLDAISRQAAIDALDTGLWGVEWDKALATTMLKDLPSVQPEIIRCRDCKWSDISAMGHLAVCNHARGLINASPNSYCNFAERRTDERTD